MPSLFLVLSLLLWLHSLPLVSKGEKESPSLGEESGEGEKKQLLWRMNEQLSLYRKRVREISAEIRKLHQEGGREERLKELSCQMSDLRKRIEALEFSWKDLARDEEKESMGFWHESRISIEDLLLQYAPSEEVYLIAEDIGKKTISVSSQLHIPRSSWEELLSWILVQNGITIQTLSPYLKQLVWTQDHSSSFEYITCQREELSLFPLHSRICYVLRPPLEQLHEWKETIEKFSSPRELSVHVFERSLWLISRVEPIRELLRILDFMYTNRERKSYRALSLKKLKAEEVKRILEEIERSQGEKKSENPSLLKTFYLPSQPHLLFLLGHEEELQRAESLIEEMEREIGNVSEHVVYWYMCKYIDSEEMVNTLQDIYSLLREKKPSHLVQKMEKESSSPSKKKGGKSKEGVEKRREHHSEKQKHFIVDKKTGAIFVVVEKEHLPQIKEVIGRLDTPQKMVHIDILLFEKKVRQDDSFGMNLMRLGREAEEIGNGTVWREASRVLGGGVRGKTVPGILQFFFSGQQRLFPHNVAYQFILTQDDIQINSNPSITTTNKIPAEISIVDERSVRMADTVTPQGGATKSFERKEFGIRIVITPSIHPLSEGESREEGARDFITLKTDIEFADFDFLQNSSADQPEVTKRKIKNEVCIPNGETIFMGGLRCKEKIQKREMIPFLGEIPGIGKFFSYTLRGENRKEMFLLITPKILQVSEEEWRREQREELQKRPGDLPCLLQKIQEGKKFERGKLFNKTLSALFKESSSP